MSEHRCPEHIVRMFDGADEKALRSARAAAIEWLEAQNIQAGDTVLLPNPETGEMISFTKEDQTQ